MTAFCIYICRLPIWPFHEKVGYLYCLPQTFIQQSEQRSGTPYQQFGRWVLGSWKDQLLSEVPVKRHSDIQRSKNPFVVSDRPMMQGMVRLVLGCLRSSSTGLSFHVPCSVVCRVELIDVVVAIHCSILWMQAGNLFIKQHYRRNMNSALLSSDEVTCLWLTHIP